MSLKFLLSIYIIFIFISQIIFHLSIRTSKTDCLEVSQFRKEILHLELYPTKLIDKSNFSFPLKSIFHPYPERDVCYCSFNRVWIPSGRHDIFAYGSHSFPLDRFWTEGKVCTLVLITSGIFLEKKSSTEFHCLSLCKPG